jgi:cytoplasmic iron level regulating protein YaaA (DUF328/UPF0246 family)
MLTILSPAKSQDFTSHLPDGLDISAPLFSDKTNSLVEICKRLSIGQIKSVMNVSDKLAELNFNRYQNFEMQSDRPAMFAYDGDVYDNIKRENFCSTQWHFLQKHTLIISGLYGALRPLDKIKPYRLEMSTKTLSLNDFWQDTITSYINDTLANHQNKCLLNLASNEYSSVINQNNLKYSIINILFKENRNNKLQVIGINAKKARGSMLNFIAENLIDIPEKLLNFSQLGYQYSQVESSAKTWVFILNNTKN